MDDGSVELPGEIWPVLVGRLWHATSVANALAILAEGSIRLDAKSPYRGAWCLNLGGVSLFDFAGDLALTTTMYDDWYKWLGHAFDGGVAVWFEIDRAKVTTKSPADQYEAWRTYAAHNSTLDADSYKAGIRRAPWPGCETCHIGALPVSAVRAVLLTDARRHGLHEFAALGDTLPAAIVDFRDRMVASRPPPVPWAPPLTDDQAAELGDRLVAARARVDKYKNR